MIHKTMIGSPFGAVALIWTAVHREPKVTRVMISSPDNPADLKAAELLIQNGALLNLKNVNGKTALGYASKSMNHDIVDLLVSSGATE